MGSLMHHSVSGGGAWIRPPDREHIHSNSALNQTTAAILTIKITTIIITIKITTTTTTTIRRLILLNSDILANLVTFFYLGSFL